MRFILIIIFVLSLFAVGFTYRSAYLEMAEGTSEYRLLFEYEDFEIPELFLIASGASDESLPGYLEKFNEASQLITSDMEITNQMELSEEIFNRMHSQYLSNFDDSSFLLTSLLETGDYNCLSATLFYISLLQEQGVEAGMVVLPNHVYTRIYVDDNFIDVETTLTDGWDIPNSEYALQSYQDIIGYTYQADWEYANIADKSGIAAVTYATRSFEDYMNGKIDASYQNSLKAIALSTNIHVVVSNTMAAIAGYSEYLLTYGYPIHSMLVIEDGLTNLPPSQFMTSTYANTLSIAVEDLYYMGLDDVAGQFLTRASNYLEWE